MPVQSVYAEHYMRETKQSWVERTRVGGHFSRTSIVEDNRKFRTSAFWSDHNSPHTLNRAQFLWHPPSYRDLDCHRTDRTPTSMAKREVSGEKGEVMAARTPCWLSEAVKDDFARPSYQQLTSLAAGGRLSPVDSNFTSPPCIPLKVLRFRRKLCLLDFLVMSPQNFSPISY